MDSNNLGTQISTFGKLMERQCCDSLTIQQYAVNELEKKEDAVKDSKEKPRPEDQTVDDEDKERDDEEQEIDAKTLLEKSKLIKFWPAMEEEGWDDPADWEEMTNDDLTEIGIKGGNLKKWKKMMKVLGGGADDDNSAEELLGLKLAKFWPKMQEEGWDDTADWPSMNKKDLE